MKFDNSYLRALPGTFLRARPDVAPGPQNVIANVALAAELGIDLGDVAQWASGAAVPMGADPVALAYSGHQFGRFSPSLGDGRAHLLCELLGPDGRRWDLQLKGSGRTPFSRGGDGKAGLGPMLREYLISESMAALGIPTTRELVLFEIKDGKKPPSKRKLKEKTQVPWHREWSGYPVHIVESVSDALAIVAAIKRGAR